MDMRAFGQWLTTGTGKLTLALVGIALLLVVLFVLNQGHGSNLAPRPVRTPQLDTNPPVTEKAFDLGPAMRSWNVQKAAAAPASPTPLPYRETEPRHEPEKRVARPLRLGTLPLEKSSTDATPNPTNRGETEAGKRDWADTAPFGRQLKCELTNTVESKNLETPVIGLTSEDFKWGGALLIPAGSEVHGVANGERVQDRIGCDTNWIVVLHEPKRHSRRELKLQAIALDQDIAPVANPADRAEFAHFGATDGSGGLRGDIVVMDIKTQLKNKAELFASAFFSAFSSSFQNTSQTVYGFQAAPTLKNAALGGVSGVMTEYAEDLRKKIEKDAEFVRVRAGKTFYLYVLQTLDTDGAQEGVMLARNQRANENNPAPNAEQIFRKLYQRKKDEQQEALGPAAAIANSQSQMAELQQQLSKVLPQAPGPSSPTAPPNVSIPPAVSADVYFPGNSASPQPMNGPPSTP
jgi:Bacterial conjugation TrbI-like protein